MIGRLVLAALIAGLAAGVVLAGIQHFRITPLILQAEAFEKAGGPDHAGHAMAETTAAPQAGHDHAGHEHQHSDSGWAPADGLERTLATSVSTLLTGAGFALVMAGVSLVTGLAITPANGLIWGLCGFLCVSVATSAGLPPELPGMPAADLFARQVWWTATISATGLGIYLLVSRRSLPIVIAAAVVIALPHIIGAPQPAAHDSAVPAGLAAAFAANTLAAAAVFWCLIGAFLGLALHRFGREVSAT